MNILSFPPWTNPYQRLLAGRLKQVGVFSNFNRDILELRTGLVRSDFNLLHLHLLPFRTREQILLLINMVLLRFRRVPVVWTVHNLFPHTESMSAVVPLYRKIVAHLCTKLICHCEEAKKLIVKTYSVDPAKIKIIPHGNYIQVYPSSQSKKEARKILEVNSKVPIFLFFGSIRSYKGLPQLVEAFRKLKNPSILFIVGKVKDLDLDKRLERLSVRDKRIRFVFEFIPEDSVATYFSAADCVVLPYTRMLTSGVASLAASFGKAVVAPRMGCIPEQLAQDDMLLYDSSDERGLTNAMNQAFVEDLEDLGKRNLAKAKEMTWESIAKETFGVYKEALDKRL